VLLDRALVREAEGLLADMMADPDLPRHLMSGLRAISDLLKSTDAPLMDAAGGFYRVKTSPVASLSDCSFTSEYADLPYAERPVYLPKVCLLSSSVIERDVRLRLANFFLSCELSNLRPTLSKWHYRNIHHRVFVITFVMLTHFWLTLYLSLCCEKNDKKLPLRL